MLSANGIIAIMIISVFSTSSADELPSDSQITPLDGNIGVEKTVLTLSIPDNNDLPWVFVEGKIVNPVLDYPVIIQIYDNDDQVKGNDVGAIHFAQTDVNEDGTYEYKFLIIDFNDGSFTHPSEGDYTVKIFKVVYLFPNLSST